MALADSIARDTFERSKVERRDDQEAIRHRALIRELLALRRGDDVLSGRSRTAIDGAVIADDAFVVRLSGAGGDDRLLLITLGATRTLRSCAEPLLAPPWGMRWKTALVTEDPRWGGRGAVDVEQADGLHLTAESCALLVPEPDPDHARRFGPPERRAR